MSSRNKKDVDPAEGSAVTVSSQISYDAFGRTETVMHWHLCVVHEAAGSQLLLHTDIFGKDDKVGNDGLITGLKTLFVLGIDYTADPELWKIGRQETDTPYTVSVWISHLGKTSFTTCSRMVRTRDNQELSTALTKLVYIDITTRQPTPLPDWFINKLSPALSTERALKIALFQPLAFTSLFHYEVTVAPSDTDLNGHMNQRNYVRICCDGAQMAVKAGKLPGYEWDINSYDLKGLQVLFFGECSMGDKLEVLLWQQRDHLEKVYFIVKKEGKDAAICQVSMTYERSVTPPPHKM